MMPFDVRLSLTLGETRLPLLQCDAVNLLRTSSKRASDVTAMPRLSQLLTEAMQQESPDSTLILLGLSFVLKSGDEQLIAKITPGIESYLQRRGHASRRDLNSSIQVRLQHADIALAVLASSLKEDVAKLPLVIELFNRAEDSARQASASSYLAAVLYAKGEYLRKRGDLAGAENAWNEMLESIIAGPDAVLDAMRSVQPSKNGASPAFDLGAELRRTLLKPAVP